ncbi:DUF2007 domain-containing protein [bacterium]|nr:DUF2007 domain-containing protein [candidate division CSSED10-310 bacterium]
MKKLYSHPNSAIVHHVRNVMLGFGIETEVMKENLAGAVGELPPNEVWVELWVADERYGEARVVLEEVVLEEVKRMDAELPEWCCPDCGELLDGRFTQCWQCGRERL